MRTIAKYKLFSKQLLDTVPVRISKFKRTKWQKSKQIFIKSVANKNSISFLQTYGVFISSKALPRIKSYFNDCLLTNTSFKQFFDLKGKINLKLSSSEFDSFYGQILLKQFFKPEILLYKLNFFSSSEEASQALSNGIILINGEKKKPNYFLKRGDIISLSSSYCDNSFFNKLILNKRFFIKKSLFSFVEIDFFTKTIVILKNIQDFNLNDITLIMPFFLNVQHLKDFKL